MRMPISSETRAALELLKDVQQKVRTTENLRSNQQINADLTTLISVLESPVFQSILNIQDSLRELKRQVQLHPSILPSDFDITPSGELVLNLPPNANQQRGNEQHPSTHSQNGIPHVNTTNDVFHREAQNGYGGEDNQDVNQNQKTAVGVQQAHPPMEGNIIKMSNLPTQVEFDEEQKNDGSHFMDEAFRQKVEAAGQGRQLKYIRLHKPEGTSLGFSVVGLKSENKGELGIYVQEIQPHGIAAKDGQLREADQILAIDGQALDSNISHQQAINILQRARGNVDLAVARNPETESDDVNENEKPKANVVAESSIGSDWCQVEVIELVNNGSGLGFGIIGGQQAGVIVKTILRDGVADKDGRLKPNDFILQINEHWLQGVGSEQVAVVLRGTGSHVRLVVARPVDPNDPSVQRPNVPILPSAILTDRKALEMHLATGVITEQIPVPPPPMAYDKFGPPPFDSFGPTTSLANDMILPTQSEQVSIQHNASKSIDQTTSPMRNEELGSLTATTRFGGSSNEESMQPEMITLDVELVKDTQGLGVTIAGYTCEREELSGIFVKSVTEGSAAYRSGKVAVNDQIIEVDGRSIQGYTNQQAVEMLRSTGQVVRLKLIRYVHGFKFEQLQQAIANSQQPQQQQKQDFPGGMVRTDSVISEEASIDISASAKSIERDVSVGEEVLEKALVEESFEGELDPEVEKGLIIHWSKIMGPQYEIAVAQMAKFKPNGGLGISLEGTVEKVDGEEQNPHHYIRSVLPNGPVGQNGKLKSGDELLEVNGKKLLGLYHTDVVSILKDLPMHVRIVCARSNQTETQTDFTNPMMARSTEYSLQGSVSSNVVTDKQDRLFKAKSDGSIASSSGTTTEASQKESKLKSRSLEPLTSLAMWSEDVIAIELVKAEKGLGFSILDYQDPMNKDETVVVIRSLVPGGVAQQDGRLIPGDRLMYVNEVDLAHASLDEAVQALKGANRGIVKIGVSKPLPVPDSGSSNTTISQEDITTQSGKDVGGKGENGSSADDNTEVRSEVSDMESDGNGVFTPPPATNHLKEQPPPLPTSPLPDDDETDRNRSKKENSVPQGGRIILPPTERLIGGSSSTVVTTRYEPKTDHEDLIPPLPSALEHNIRVLKDSETLGVQVDIEEDGINGLVVRSIVPTGTLGRDGRIQAGDYMVKVNGENMRNISLNQALDILRRTQKVPLGNEIPITYIPASDAAVHKTSVITRITTEKEVTSKSEEGNNQEGKEVVEEESSIMKSAASFENMPLSSGNSAPTPAARNTLLSSSTTRTEKKANGTTVISIGPGTSMARTAPLVSPEGSEVDKSSPDTRKTSAASTNLAFHESGISLQPPQPQLTANTNKSTVYLNDTTRDESTTDDVVGNRTEIDSISPQPIIPPRPSKETTSSCSSVSSSSHSSHHSSPSKKVSTIELRNDNEKEGDTSLSSQINQMQIIEPKDDDVNEDLSKEEEQQEQQETQIFQTVDDKELEEASLSSQHWGPERTVEVVRVPGHGLGISIVGGKIDPFPRKGSKQGTSSAAVTGIFIKNVLAGSPAGATGQLCTGDRILEVDGNDLRKASHEKAVEIIRQSGNVVEFVVQSLLAYDEDEDEHDEDLDQKDLQSENLENVSSAIDSIPAIPPPGFENEFSDRASNHSDSDPSTLPPPPPPPLMEEMDGNSNWSQSEPKEVFEDDDSEGEDETDDTKFSGQVTLPNGLVIDRGSAAFLTKSKNDQEIEDDYGYTSMKVHKKYQKDSHERGVPKLVSLNKGTNGLGISLAGHKDRSQMAIYICGLNPLGNAARVGGIEIGDLILEVNGTVLHNRHHLNASALIKNLPDSDVTFVLMRKESGAQDDVAVKPLTQFPPEPFKDNPIDRYSGKYKNVREVLLKKGQTGWGIMILEGKHSIAGTGVFVSDLQPGSCAEKAGLLRGDMILAVNGEDFVGVNYDTAARILKTLDGVITMIVANANIDCNASNHNAPPSSTDETAEEKPAAPESPEKPKLPPKPAIAPKPAGLSPSHTATKPVPSLGLPSQPDSNNEPPTDVKPTTPVKKPEPIKTTAPQPPAAAANKTKKPVASPRRRGPGSSGDECSANPSTCEIVPGADTSIEITKDKDEDGKPMGLGLSIVGGSDTLLGAIFIHEVYEKGAAHKDGRLRPGDQILEVMSENLRNVTHSHALQALRQTPNRVKLIIHREDDEIYETLEVELLKKKDRGLGLSIVGKKSGPGVFISEVVKGGAADADGRLVQGDQILAVNGNDLTNSSQEEAAPVLKMAQGKILMQVRRLRVGNRRHQQQQQNKDDAEHGGGSRDKSLPPQPVMNGNPAVIELKRGEHGLGFSIVGGFGSPHGDMPVYVKTVFDTGAAAEHGGLKRGDQILSVNGNSLEGLTHLEAVNILKNCEGTVTLHIIS